MNPDLLTLVRDMKSQGLNDTEITTKLTPQYASNEIIQCLAALKDMQPAYAQVAQSQTANSKGGELHNSTAESGRVIDRHPRLKFWAIAPLLPLILMFPYFAAALSSVKSFAPSLVHHHNAASLEFTGLYIWSALIFITTIALSVIIFVARKEETIKRYIYSVMVTEAVFIALYTIATRSPILLIYGIFQLYFYWLISKKIGILSQI